MANPEKIKLMLKAETYRQTEYSKDAFAQKYFKNDYLGMQRLISMIWLTIFYALYLAFVVIRDFYVNTADMLHFDYKGFVVKALIIYLLLAVAVCIVTTLFAERRYDKAKVRIEEYCDLVDQIAAFEDEGEEE